VELYLHSPNTPSWRGAQLGEHRIFHSNLYDFKMRGAILPLPQYVFTPSRYFQKIMHLMQRSH
jgi:hypothetical protein